jgi:hypothetical protein
MISFSDEVTPCPTAPPRRTPNRPSRPRLRASTAFPTPNTRRSSPRSAAPTIDHLG